MVEHFFTRFVATAGYEVLAIPFKEPTAILEAARWAHAIFIQWDGKEQMGHELIQRMNQFEGSLRPTGLIYCITTSSIKIAALPPKLSRQANITSWYELPDDKENLLSELSLLMPDDFDDFSGDLAKADLPLLHELQLESLAGKHLIGTIKKAWDDRNHRATTTTRIKDEILRSHVTFFHEDDARTNDFRSFLTEVRFKYHDEFSDLITCMRWIRGHGTDCIVVWYDPKSKKSATLLRMVTESRSFARIPLVVVYAAETDLAHFKKTYGDLYIDKFIQFDRIREKFRNSVIEAFETVKRGGDHRSILSELRAQAQDLPGENYKPLSASECEAACDQIGTDPSKRYWADTERLIELAKLKDLGRFTVLADDYGRRYRNFDASLSLLVAQCIADKDSLKSRTQVFAESIFSLKDLNGDRLARAAITLCRLSALDALRILMQSWWSSRDTYPIGDEFYFVLSRMAQQSGLLALERSLLALAVRGDPLRNDYIEAYALHLLQTGHPAQTLRLAEQLKDSEYFPLKKALMISLHAYIQRGDTQAATKILDELIAKWPHDKQVATLKKLKKSG